MPPYAICSSPTCAYLFDLRDDEVSSARLPPEDCPTCRGKVIFYCRVCYWLLLVIPRQDIPMCRNCYARLRQVEELVGEKLAIRKYLFQAALQKNKVLDEANRGTGIEMIRISQASSLALDLYCEERKPVYSLAKSSLKVIEGQDALLGRKNEKPADEPKSDDRHQNEQCP